MDTSPSMPSEHNPYQSTVIDDLSHLLNEKEVELASPWARISAVLINSVLNIAVMSPMLYSLVISFKNDSSAAEAEQSIFFSFGMLLLLGLAVWQMIWMTKRGQSVGKSLMHIKIIGLDGEKLGFSKIVLMREMVFGFVVKVIINIVIVVLVGIHLMASDINAQYYQLLFLYCAPYIICLIMLFFPKNARRTLQDYLAKTMVIKV